MGSDGEASHRGPDREQRESGTEQDHEEDGGVVCVGQGTALVPRLMVGGGRRREGLVLRLVVHGGWRRSGGVVPARMLGRL